MKLRKICVADIIIVGLSALLAYWTCTAVLYGQPPQQGSKVIQMNQEQQLLFQNLLLQQENLRVHVCLSNGVTEEECGQLIQGGVMRLPKKPEQATAKPEAAKPEPPKVAEVKK